MFIFVNDLIWFVIIVVVIFIIFIVNTTVINLPFAAQLSQLQYLSAGENYLAFLPEVSILVLRGQYFSL